MRDLQAKTTTLVSISTDGIDPGNGDSYSPIISADGRYVLFRSKASNLASGSFTGENLFLRDLQTGTTYALTAPGSSSSVYPAAMTPDGRYVAIWGSIPGGSGVNVYVWNTALAAITYTNSLLSSLEHVFCYFHQPERTKTCLLGRHPSGGLYVIDVISNTFTTIQPSWLISHALRRLAVQ